jgi:hypothetical protein
MQQHKQSWNIVNVGYGRNNITVERLSDGPYCGVRYPKGSINPTAVGRPVGGIGFYAAPASIFPALDAEVSYKLAFDPSFNPQNGGKLPGLFLGKAGSGDFSGGSGGRHDDLHASCRLMWRGNFQAEAYVYTTIAHAVPEYLALPKSHYNAEFGDSLWRGILKFKRQGWNTVRVRVRVNTPGVSDGALYVTVNDTTVQFENMAWRSRKDVVISALFFSTFYGGSSEKFACPNDTQARFRDFALKKFA